RFLEFSLPIRGDAIAELALAIRGTEERGGDRKETGAEKRQRYRQGGARMSAQPTPHALLGSKAAAQAAGYCRGRLRTKRRIEREAAFDEPGEGHVHAWIRLTHRPRTV